MPQTEMVNPLSITRALVPEHVRKYVPEGLDSAHTALLALKLVEQYHDLSSTGTGLDEKLAVQRKEILTEMEKMIGEALVVVRSLVQPTDVDPGEDPPQREAGQPAAGEQPTGEQPAAEVEEGDGDIPDGMPILIDDALALPPDQMDQVYRFLIEFQGRDAFDTSLEEIFRGAQMQLAGWVEQDGEWRKSDPWPELPRRSNCNSDIYMGAAWMDMLIGGLEARGIIPKTPGGRNTKI